MGLFRKKKRLDDGFIDMVRAHDNGEEWAQKFFDDGYDSGNPDFIRRFQEARLQIYKKAAEQGDPNACCMMGKSYMFLGDEAQSFKWFKPLIDREDGYALSIISFGYNEFGGFPPDHDQEMYWLKRSAESGYAPSQVDLGREYKIEHHDQV